MRSAKRTIKNSIYSFANQICTLGLALLLRMLTIKYIGVEVLGISSAFTSFLGTLSLAELGFNTAITYFLYTPLHEKNYDKVSAIISVFRFVYTGVAIFVGIAALLFTPMLGSLLKGTSITTTVYILYFLMVLDTVASYLLSYKRILFYADQKDYFTQRVDIISNVIFGVTRIGALVIFHRYDLFLLTKVLQTILSNVYIHKKCKLLYPKVTTPKLNTSLFKEIFASVKHVFGSKIAYYINTSTDSLVISSLIGTVVVGIFTNYTTITFGIKRLIVSLMKPVSPLIGDMLADQTVDYDKREKTLRLYTHITFIIAIITLIPAAVLLDPFIYNFYGKEFLLNINVSRLLVIDLYINFLQRGCADYINVQGLFSKDKYIEYFSAIANIIISVCLANKIGVVGVLIGTVVSGIFAWLGRGYVVYKYSFHNVQSGTLKFLFANLKYIAGFIVAYYLSELFSSMISPQLPVVLKFVIAGMVCELVVVAVYIIFFYKCEENIIVKKIFHGLLLKERMR